MSGRLHGFYIRRFSNPNQLGAVQDANSANFVHVLQKEAKHISAVLARARATGARRSNRLAGLRQRRGARSATGAS